jgi:hypothetical protein
MVFCECSYDTSGFIKGDSVTETLLAYQGRLCCMEFVKSNELTFRTFQ